MESAYNVAYSTKYPILLTRDDHFTHLIICHHHEATGHSGIQGTINSIRMAMWIPKLGKIVKKMIQDCARCKLHKGSKYHIPKSPPLPEYRVEDADPYTYVGVDMTGHFWVKIGK